MTNSKTASFLSRAIAQSARKQKDISIDAGFPHSNVISMFKTGETKVPIDRIPALAAACGADPKEFLVIAMEEYYPAAWSVLRDVLGEPISTEEDKLLAAYHLANCNGDVVIDARMFDVLSAVFEFARGSSAS